METKQSLTITGLIVAILAIVFQKIGLPITDGVINDLMQKILELSTQIAEVLGIIIAYWGRYRQGDVKPFGQIKRSGGEIDFTPPKV